jgi:hypothetical protein
MRKGCSPSDKRAFGQERRIVGEASPGSDPYASWSGHCDGKLSPFAVGWA